MYANCLAENTLVFNIKCCIWRLIELVKYRQVVRPEFWCQNPCTGARCGGTARQSGEVEMGGACSTLSAVIRHTLPAQLLTSERPRPSQRKLARQCLGEPHPALPPGLHWHIHVHVPLDT